eukprot:COSAG01_NODE_47781_length_387_cov_0.659722_1_plen_49_part_10
MGLAQRKVVHAVIPASVSADGHFEVRTRQLGGIVLKETGVDPDRGWLCT